MNAETEGISWLKEEMDKDPWTSKDYVPRKWEEVEVQKFGKYRKLI